MTRFIAIAALLCACAPAYRLKTGRCPTTAIYLADVTVSGAGLAGAVWAYNDGHELMALGLAVGAMSLALADSFSGDACR